MGMNARSKGARGERLWRDELNSAGFTGSRRNGQQGGGGSFLCPDVECPSLSNIHWEVKNVQALNVREAMTQAVNDACGSPKIPIVSWKKNNQPWLVVLRADDFFRLAHSGSIVLTNNG